jgi:hypothetical protein
MVTHVYGCVSHVPAQIGKFVATRSALVTALFYQLRTPPS